jgi:plastocyanin
MRKQSMVMILIALLLVTATAFLVLRKDSNNGTSPVTSSSDVKTSADGQPGTNPASSGNSTELEIDNFAFSPETITIKKGTKLTWTNKDSVEHTVTGDDGKGPDSGPLSQGETYSYTFNEAGSFAYHCAPHPSMKATVIVTE